MTSEADEAVGVLAGFVQLPQTGQLPTRCKVRCRALVAFGFLFIQYATAQTRGDADHTVEPVEADELTPLLCDIQFVLGGHCVGRRAVYTILIKEQPDNLVPARQHRLGETQGAA